MEILYSIYLVTDSFLIRFYRGMDHPMAGYLAGTAFLCLVCIILGKLSFWAASLANRKYLEKDYKRMMQMQNLSFAALAQKNKKAYKAANHEANEAFGKTFFSGLALGLASLWPVPFALGWMQTRFLHVEFPLAFPLPFFGKSVGFVFTFVLLYILTGIGTKWILGPVRVLQNRKNMVSQE